MFLTQKEFKDCVQAAIPRFSKNWLNSQQNNSVLADPFPPIFIVAGPGTGKTTVLALRVLKLIFVDGFNPESILATTFTRKAANELRSRILSWGYALQIEVLRLLQLLNDVNRLPWVNSIDINSVMTGTLDSIAEDMIADDRIAGEITPAIIEKFMAEGLLRRNVMYTNRRDRDRDLEQHLCRITPEYPSAYSFSNKLSLSHSIADRVLHDSIDLNSYSQKGTGEKILSEIVTEYHNYLTSSHMMDFAMLEKSMLDRLKQGRLSSITGKLKAILVDEFQDTNYMQEQIYYQFCRNSGASFTVVGDDDQSIYRFRGATVEIFADFGNRIVSELGKAWNPIRFDLVENYRSTQRIVDLCNHFIATDVDYQTARAPGKKRFKAAATWAYDPTYNIPVLGMFRDNVNILATDMCNFLRDVFRANGFNIPIAGGNGSINIQRGQGGDFGDAVLLSSKVSEENSSGNARLPQLIRLNLSRYNIRTFNPRGRNLSTIPEVCQCLGLMLECIDPGATIQNSIGSIKTETSALMSRWRTMALHFATQHTHSTDIQQFLADWASRSPRSMSKWPNDWPLLELLFTIITWFPIFQNNPEGQVYLEVIARTIAVAGKVSPYRAKILYGNIQHDRLSVQNAIREIFEPIAEGNVDVDEEIMPYVPRNYFPIMTVHQAKGLEFPLVFVDVGSDFRTDHHTQRRFRFPTRGDNVHHIEDDVARYTPVGAARLSRPSRNRAFDDLRRLYYVGKSRAQNVLIFVGLTSQIRLRTPIQGVATGDILNGNRVYIFDDSTKWTYNSPDNFITLI